MNDIQIFNNPTFGEIRTVILNGEPWFVGNDIAKALGYAKPQNAISTHCRHALKQGIGVQTGNKADGTPSIQNVEMLIIPEGDMYRLISKSKLKSAEQFEEWVFDEVLPTIRKTGSYGQPQTLQGQIQLLAKGTDELYQRVDAVTGEVQTVKSELESLKNDMPVFTVDAKDIQNALRKKAIEVLGGKGSNAYNDKSVRSYAFADIQIELRRQFGVKRYDQIKHKDVPIALKIIEEYKPPIHIRDKIQDSNAQQRLDV